MLNRKRHESTPATPAVIRHSFVNRQQNTYSVFHSRGRERCGAQCIAPLYCGIIHHMSTGTISVQVPEPVFRRLERVAAVTHRSVADVLTTSVNLALPRISDLSDDLADELAAMSMLSDEALWAAESAFSPAQQRQLEQLSHAGGLRTLSGIEAAELKQLVDLQDRSVLRRAQAFAILAHRGYNLPDQANLSCGNTIDDDTEDPQTVV
jgi:hypothetical protein